MKQFIYLFSGLLLLFASTPRVVAQEIGDYSQLNDEDYSKIDLPPLSVLFENAKNNPIYELADAKTAIERKLLQKEKWAFLGFFSLRGSYQYGMFGNESTYTDVAIAPYLTYSTQAQNGYTLGAGVSIPLNDLFADSRFGLGGSEIAFDSPTREELIPQFLDECSFNGTYYAVPYMRSTEACYINRDLVEKLGYTIPDTLTSVSYTHLTLPTIA